MGNPFRFFLPKVGRKRQAADRSIPNTDGQWEKGIAMSDSDLNNERRSRDRRRADAGPPIGTNERRINIERRLFNLGIDCGKAWLGKPASKEAAKRSSADF